MISAGTVPHACPALSARHTRSLGARVQRARQPLHRCRNARVIALAERAPLQHSRRLVLETILLSSVAIVGPGCAEDEEGALAVQKDFVGDDPSASSKGKTKVFFDFLVDGKPEGRVVVEAFEDVAVGGQRFIDLAKGRRGVGYRRSKVDLIEDDYIRLDGVASLSYDSSGESPITGGEDTFKLEEQMKNPAYTHDQSGMVSLVVKSSVVREAKTKLVAVNGKLVNITEDVGNTPNGTGFVITTGPAQELDSTNLVVGRVVEGMETVNRIAALPAVKDNTMSPYFMAAKAIGDKRADVAEKGFKRPYSKIVVSKSGVML